MDLDDSSDFTRRLIALGELFDASLTPVRQALYFEALRDVPFPAVAHALNQAAKTCTFFPRPAELRALALGDAESVAEAAWMALKRAMSTAGGYASLVCPDAALGEAVLALWGSWPAACASELSPEMWAAKRKEFGRVYRVLSDRQLDGARYLPGICEQQNAGTEDWKRFIPVSVLEGHQVRPLGPAEAETCRQAIAAQSHELTRMTAERIAKLVPAQKGETA